MSIQHISPNSSKVLGPYSPIVNFGDMYFFSGQIGLNSQGELITNLEGQFKQAMKNLELLLKYVDMSYNNLVKVTLYISDMSYYKIINEIYSEYFTANQYPARTVVEVSNLPAHALVEIDAIAMRKK